jgi:hypothetical protein
MAHALEQVSHPEGLPAPSPPARWDVVTPVVMLAFTALKLWLVAPQPIGALPIAGYDDGLYLRLAHHLIVGEWLGPYDHITLLKPPGYSLWIAANYFTGLPLHLTQHLLYAGACALFVYAIRPCVPSRLLRLGLFVLLLFQPLSYSTSTQRYVRDSLYTSQVLALIGCLLGLVMSVDAPLRVVWRWSIAAGLIGGFIWITRDEGIVLKPAIGAAGVMIAARQWWSRR